MPVLALALTGSLAGGALAQAVFGDERPRLPGRPGDGHGAAVADLDGDGLADLVRVTTAGVEVLVQGAGGTFARRQLLGLSLASGARPIEVAVLRPPTGLPDLVVAVTGDDARWLRNDGTGRFGPSLPGPFARPGGFTGATTGLLVGQLDSRPGDDVVVLHDRATPQLFLRGAGGFSEKLAAFPAAFMPLAPAGVIAPLAGGGLDDVAVVQRGTGDPPVLFRNLGGAFAPVAGAFTGWSRYLSAGITDGDVNGDGARDLVLVPVSGRPRVLAGNGAGAFAPPVAAGFVVAGARAVTAGDIDRDGDDDLWIADGRGAVWTARATAGGLPSAVAVLPTGYQALALADLEGDGDADLIAIGGEIEDRLLLGDGRGAFVDTERQTMPIGSLPEPVHWSLLDINGDGDLDLAGYSASGTPSHLLNDGSARFSVGPSRLPAMGRVRGLTAAAVSGTRRQDLALLAARPGGAGVGVRILIAAAQSHVEETLARWPVNAAVSYVALTAADLVTSAGSNGRSEIVTADVLGQLRLFVNRSGVYRLAAGAFGTHSVMGTTQLLTGFVDGDGLLDVIVLRAAAAPAVFLGRSAGGFRQVPLPIAGPYAATRAAIDDVTGDGVADLLLVRPAPVATLALLAGNGDGTFLDASNRLPSPLPAGLTDVTTVADPGARVSAIALTSAVAPDVLLRWSNGGYSPAAALPSRGSEASSAWLVGDLDLDGDDDLVVTRSGFVPRVLFHHGLQLTSLGTDQPGRLLELRLHTPAPGLAVLFLGAPSRLPWSPFGILRLQPSSLLTLGQFPVAGAFDDRLPLPPQLSAFVAWVQAAHIDGQNATLRLSNAELIEITTH